MIQENENSCIAILYNLVLALIFENMKHTLYQNYILWFFLAIR